MPIESPPRPAELTFSHDTMVEALIEEARQRARRRRRIYGCAAAILALGAVAMFAGRAAMPPSHGAAPSLTNPPTAPALRDRGSAPTLVASYTGLHVGWVVIYADGRVIYNYDGPRMYQRFLTHAGLERVRSGEIAPELFVRWGHDVTVVTVQAPPDDLWADDEPRTYIPTEYAACVVDQSTDPVRPLDATSALSQLSAPAQALLHGKHRNYITFGLQVDEPHVPAECFAMTGEDRIVALSDPDHFPQSPATSAESSQTTFLFISPVLPHGERLVWGG